MIRPPLVQLCLYIVSGAVLAACDTDPRERNTAGNELYAQERYEDALGAYQAAQVAAPDLAEPYYNAASALAEVGRLQSAVAALRQALKSSDRELSAHAYHNLGNVYFEMSRYEDAITAYREALRLEPDAADTRYNYELALRRLPTPTPTPFDVSPQPQPSPTPDLAAGQGQTPTQVPEAGGEQTPTPQGGSGESGSEATETPTPLPDSELSREEAETILDAVEQNQQAMRPSFADTAAAATPEKDW